jgi:hypothetical protein
MHCQRSSLERTEWDFAWVKTLDDYGFIKCCHDYEFARELPDDVKEAIMACRASAKSTDFEGLLEHSWQMGRIGPLRNFYPFPEWPDFPIGSIDRKILSDRIQQLGYRQPYREWSGEALAAIIDPRRAIWDTPRRHIELSIPEASSHEELRLFFDAYLREHFPNQSKRKSPDIGGGARVRQMKANLKSLGAWRLLDRGWTANAATKYTEAQLGKALYSNESKWSTAKCKAGRVISEFRSLFQVLLNP